MTRNRSRLASIVRQTCSCCWVNRCHDAGCSVSMPRGGEPRAILSGTLRQRNHSHTGALCDFIVFYSPSHVEKVFALELKSGAVDVSQILRQIQAGAKLAEELTADAVVSFLPVLVHGGRIPAPERKVLAQKRITFRGNKYEIFSIRCGSPIPA